MRHPRLLLVALATTLAACGSQQLERLTDADWASRFASGESPPDVPWLAGLVVR